MRAKRERIQPDKLHVRKDGDKVLYSQVMVVEVGGTRQIFVAGQTPRDRHGNCVGKGDMRAQIEQVGENIKAALEAAGALTTSWPGIAVRRTASLRSPMSRASTPYFASKAWMPATSAGMTNERLSGRVAVYAPPIASCFHTSQESPSRCGSCRSSGWTYLIGRRNDSAMASCCAFTSV